MEKFVTPANLKHGRGCSINTDGGLAVRAEREFIQVGPGQGDGTGEAFVTTTAKSKRSEACRCACEGRCPERSINTRRAWASGVAGEPRRGAATTGSPPPVLNHQR